MNSTKIALSNSYKIAIIMVKKVIFGIFTRK